MKTLTVDLGDRSYPIIVGERILPHAGRTLARLGCSAPPIVIGDADVIGLHGEPLLASLRDVFGAAPLIRMRAGESCKNHTTLFRIYDALFRRKAHRNSWIIAFGGGVVGDVAGFAAATFLRGVPYVNVPTTLLAQVDSSVGGKVGINVPQGKNLIGAFHQPTAVLSDTGVLRSLPRRELVAGLYEVIKCAAIESMPLVRYLERDLDRILKCRSRALTQVVAEACRIKARVVSFDEREQSRRMVLNFGHTVGHALEAATGYRRFRHGEAVAWGMLAALGVGALVGRTAERDARRLARLIHRVAPLPALRSVAFDGVWRAFERDKKFRGEGIRMVILPRLGAAEVVSGLDSRTLKGFLREFLSRQGALEQMLSDAHGPADARTRPA
jgi:3-dehydroquinate synthase